MQQADWGHYSQAPWMNGGAWKDTNQSRSSRKLKAKYERPAQVPTKKHVQDVSKDKDASSQDAQDEDIQAQSEIIDLRMQLQRWTFARSWRTTRSSPPAADTSEDEISPLSRPQDAETPILSPGKSQTTSDDLVPPPGHGTDVVGVLHAPLDRRLMGQYLDGCIKVAEAKLAKATNKAAKEEVVKEIEQLVERVIAEAGRLETQEGRDGGR
ncbi:hypothetical protein BDR22DRAFT_861383 [Usnea florida]